MTEWKHLPNKAVEATGGKVWEREAALGTIYYVTKNRLPPNPECGGFYRLQTALWVANVTEDM